MPAPRVTNIEDAYELVEQLRLGFDVDVEQLAYDLWAGNLSVNEWRSEKRRLIKLLLGGALIISRGGIRANVTLSDWDMMGAQCHAQYVYLRGFAESLEKAAYGNLMGLLNLPNVDYIAKRSSQYGKSAHSAFWTGLTYGLLAQVPGDGKTRCKFNCGCHLEIEPGDTKQTIYVYWILDPALENCEDCQQLTKDWTPYVVQIPFNVTDASNSLGLDIRATMMKAIRKDQKRWLDHLHGRLHHDHGAAA